MLSGCNDFARYNLWPQANPTQCLLPLESSWNPMNGCCYLPPVQRACLWSSKHTQTWNSSSPRRVVQKICASVEIGLLVLVLLSDKDGPPCAIFYQMSNCMGWSASSTLQHNLSDTVFFLICFLVSSERSIGCEDMANLSLAVWFVPFLWVWNKNYSLFVCSERHLNYV